MSLKYPFLTELFNKKTEENFIVLIQSISKNYISYYYLKDLRKEDRERFLRFADTWWKNEPTLPISMYYKEFFDQFDYCKKYLASNEYNIVEGYEGIILKNLSDKRIKRKIIHLD